MGGGRNMKKPKKTPGNKGDKPLPKVNVEFATGVDTGKMTVEKYDR
jgi:hypothetical protein